MAAVMKIECPACVLMKFTIKFGIAQLPIHLNELGNRVFFMIKI